MTENKNNLHLTQAIPLQDRKVPETFYAGANRGDVLLRMTKGLEQGVALLVLSGEEGSGKTMICRLLEREASRFCFTVFLSKNVESFEDVVKKVAMQLGLAIDAGPEGKNIDRTLDRITAHLKRESTGLLIIFDEAENIYLATLERVRKMLDRITQAGTRLHIVFSGRKTFLDNFAQLSVYFKNSVQLQFDLMPLTEQETGEYLHAYAKEADHSDRRVFNDEIVRNIYSLAQGNFGKTSLLAEESMRTHGDDTSFMVLLENVKEEVGEKRGRKRQGVPQLLKGSVHYLPWVGGIGCILLLLFFLMKPGGGDRREEMVDTHGETVERVKVAEAVSLPEIKEAEEKAAPTPQEEPSIPQAAQEQTRDFLSSGSPAAESSPSEMLSDGPVAEGRLVDYSEESAAREAPITDVAEGTQENKVVPPPEIVSTPPPQTVVVKQLRLERPVKIKKVLASDKISKTTIKVQPPTVKETIGVKSQLSVDQVLQRRMAAGSAWTRKDKEGAYTMQLMALTDKNAEDNLKKMLAQPQYRKESGNFYIFKKSPGSPVVFVFYGEYPTLAMARESQNNLPPFLRTHQPYAISIKRAMEKVRD